jgi:hypothetical protein
MTPDLLSWSPPEPKGATFDPERDAERLSAQARRVYDEMRFGQWWTLAGLSVATGDPEASVSARLRDLRRLPGYDVEREYVRRGLHRYRLVKAA